MDVDEALKAITNLAHYEETHKLERYTPYEYQLKFHNAKGYQTDLPATQRVLMAANQIGKTYSGAMEMAMHLTGFYHDWYKGPRFRFPIVALCSGMTNESVRDILQKELLGDPADESKKGTGSIPYEAIDKIARKAGVPNAIDSAQIRHKSGGKSKIIFRAYEQGWEKFMGFRIDLGWLDEEPPEEVWAQCIRATFSTKGYLYMTFTPEKGITKVVHQFLNDLKPGQALVRAGWDDAPHMNDERREQFLAQIPPHQRDMRTKGVPIMGSGLVYPVAHDELFIDPVEIPRHWPRICGVDFGIGHAFAAVWMAWDRDTDTVYVYDEYKVEGEKIPVHVSKVKSHGEWIPVIWPHDGLNREKSSGKPLAELYRKEGANMLPFHFSNPPSPGVEEGKGGNSVEFGIEEILNRMQVGRFRIFKTLKHIRDEISMYHRQDGKIVKHNDDLMDAMRYAALSLRHARTPSVRMPRMTIAAGASNW